MELWSMIIIPWSIGNYRAGWDLKRLPSPGSSNIRPVSQNQPFSPAFGTPYGQGSWGQGRVWCPVGHHHQWQGADTAPLVLSPRGLPPLALLPPLLTPPTDSMTCLINDGSDPACDLQRARLVWHPSLLQTPVLIENEVDIGRFPTDVGITESYTPPVNEIPQPSYGAVSGGSQVSLLESFSSIVFVANEMDWFQFIL